MKKYVVAITSLYENDLKQFLVEAESDVAAVKEASILSYESEEEREKYKRAFDIWYDCTSLESLKESMYNVELLISVLEIPNN